MPPRRSDWINWPLVRRTALLPAAALLLVLATSFRPETPPQAQLPPAFTEEQGTELARAASSFDQLYPDRRAGTPGGIAAADWVGDRFRAVGLDVETRPATSDVPGRDEAVGLVNVEATLPGRTAERVVLVAPRDTVARTPDPRNAAGTLALVELAEELAASRDRRRTYVFVSTDGSAIGAGGARALADQLQDGPRVVAVIGLDRIGGDDPLTLARGASGDWVPPLGLTRVADDAFAEEGLVIDRPSVPGQMLSLALPYTSRENGQLVGHGLPAIELSGADGELGTGEAPSSVDGAAAATAIRVVQRIMSTLDGVDALQTSGKTYVATEDRVYRGWALKVFIASLLAPVWMAVATLVLRLRQRANLVLAVGSVARAGLAGLWTLLSFWLLGAIGLIPRASEHPVPALALPSPGIVVLLLWCVLASVGWVLARGPDSRRAHERNVDLGTRSVAVASLVGIAGLVLAVQPYLVLLVVPVLYAALMTCSTWLPRAAPRAAAVGVGIAVPALAGLVVATRMGAGSDASWFWLMMVQTRSVPALVSLLTAIALGIGLLAAMTMAGRVGRPAMLRVRQQVELQQRRQRGSGPRPSISADGSDATPAPRDPIARRIQSSSNAGQLRVKNRYSGQKAIRRP